MRDATGQIRNFDDIIIDLGYKWDGLSRNAQRYVATVAAGSRQQSRLIALLDDFDRTIELMNTATESEGKADEQFVKYADTMEYKLNQLATEWEKFKTSIIEEDLFKNAIDSLTEFIQNLNGIKVENLFDLTGLGAAIATTITGAIMSVNQMKGLWKNAGSSFTIFKNTMWENASKNIENKRAEKEWKINNSIKQPVIQPHLDLGEIQRDLVTSERLYRMYAREAGELYANEYSTAIKNFNQLNPVQKVLATSADDITRSSFFKSLGNLGGTTEGQNQIIGLINEMRQLPEATISMDAAFERIKQKYQELAQEKIRYGAQYNNLVQGANNEKAAVEMLNQQMENNIRIIDENRQEQARYRQEVANATAEINKENEAAARAQKRLNAFKTGTSLVSNALSTMMMYLPSVITGTVSLGDAAKMAGSQLLVMATSQAINKTATELAAAATAAKAKIDAGATAQLWSLTAAELAAAAPLVAYGLIVVGVVAAVAGLYLGIKAITEAFDAETQSTKKLNKEQKKLEETQKKLQETASEAKTAEEEYKKINNLKKEYDEISAIKNKTLEQQDREKQLIDQIREEFPEVVLSYNEATQEIQTQNELWESIIEKQKISAELAGKKYMTSAIVSGEQELTTLQAQKEFDEYYDESSVTNMQKSLLSIYKRNINKDNTFKFDTIDDIKNQLDKSALQYLKQYGEIDLDNVSKLEFMSILSGEDTVFWDTYQKNFDKKYEKEAKDIQDKTTGLILNSFQYMGLEINDTEKRLLAELIPKTETAKKDLINKYSQINLTDFNEEGWGMDPAMLSYNELIKNSKIANAFKGLDISEEAWNKNKNKYDIMQTVQLYNAIENYTKETIDVLDNLSEDQKNFVELLISNNIDYTITQINTQMDNLFDGASKEITDAVRNIKENAIKNIKTDQLDKFNIEKSGLTLSTQENLNNAFTNFWSKASTKVTETEQSNFVDLLKNNFSANQMIEVLSSISIEKYNPLDKEGFINSLRDSLKEGLSDTSSVDIFVDDFSKKISSGTFENLFTSKDADVAQLKEYGEKAYEVSGIFADNAKELSQYLNLNQETVAITADEYKSLEKIEDKLIEAGVEGADQILRMTEDGKEFILDIEKANEIREKYGEKAIQQIKEQKEEDQKNLDNAKNLVAAYEGQLASGKGLNKTEREILANARAEVDAKTEEVAEADKLIKRMEEQDEISKRIADNFNTATGRLSAMSSLAGSVSSALSNFQKNKFLGQSDISSLQETFGAFGIDANKFINKSLGLNNPETLYKTAIRELQKSIRSGVFGDDNDKIVQAKGVIAELYSSWMEYLEDVEDEQEKIQDQQEKIVDKEKDIEEAKKKVAEQEEKVREKEEQNEKDRKKALEDIKKAEEDLVKAKEDYVDQLEVIEEKHKAINDEIEKYNELLYGTKNRQGKLDVFYNYEEAISSLSNELSRTTELLGTSEDINGSVEALERYTKATSNLIATERAKQIQIQAGLSNYANMIENGYASYTNKETGEQIGINFGQYAKKDQATGKYILNQRLLNQASFNDDYKNLIEENIETYNKYVDEYEKINDEILKNEKELQDKRKAALKSYSEIEQKVADALKQQYEKEVDELKNKYDSMKAADDDYLSALEEAINKQRELREREDKYEELAEQEKKLSLLQRDTSGTRQLDANKLKKDVEKTRKQLLDDAVNDVVDGLKKLAQENEETRQVELQLRDAIIDNTAHWNGEAQSIVPTFTNAESYANYMANLNPDYSNMTLAQQQVLIEEYKQEFADALEYQAWNLLDTTAASGDAIVDTINVSTDQILAITTEKTTSFTEEVIRSYDEITDKVVEDLENQEKSIQDARDALQDAIDKLDELSEKINEAAQKIVDLRNEEAKDNEKRIKELEEEKEKISELQEDVIKKTKELTKEQEELAKAQKKASENIPGLNEVVDVAAPNGNSQSSTASDQVQNLEQQSSTQKALTLSDKYPGSNLVMKGKTYGEILDALREAIIYENNAAATYSGVKSIPGKRKSTYLQVKELKDTLGLTGRSYNATIDEINEIFGTRLPHMNYSYAKGGLVNYTGPAWVDGTRTAPEAFLSAADTKAIGAAAQILSDLQLIKDYDSLGQSINNTIGDTSIEINLNIDKLSSEIDINDMITRVKDEIVSVANPIGINTILRQN